MSAYRTGLVSRLRNSAVDINWIIGTFPADGQDRSLNGEWSAKQIVEHLRTIEHGVHVVRLQAALLHDNPAFPRFVADVWRAANRPQPQTLAELLADFQDGRREVISCLDRLGAADWERPAKSAVFGTTTIELLAERFYTHTLDHLQQLIMVRRACLDAHANGENGHG